MFDTSNYREDNVYGIPPSLPKLGKMKDEYAGQIIKSFYGTGAKAYCIQMGKKTVKTAKGVKKYVIDKKLSAGAKAYCIQMGKKTVKTAKGVKKYVIDKKLSVADYVDVVEDSGTIMRTRR
ncbi:hypothetical protein QE152_g29230 [Popillia japonica]|uniref:Uncharacterized protein n=1 Tax=Popillia japonica TaxID=7064 RepID=A0AAW1JJL0_POPJA